MVLQINGKFICVDYDLVFKTGLLVPGENVPFYNRKEKAIRWGYFIKRLGM